MKKSTHSILNQFTENNYHFLKTSLPVLLFMYLIPAVFTPVQSQNFTWSTAVDNGATVSETVNGVTATVSTSNGNAQLVNGGGFDGSTGEVAFTETPDDNTSLTITFSQAVDVASIFAFIADNDVGAESSVVFTPTGGSNSPVTEGISQTAGEVVSLNFSDITAITLTLSSGGFETFGIDEIVIGIPNSAPTASSFTASPGPVEDVVYTFATADFGYNDTDGDPLNNILVELIPPVGTLYVDANNSDTFDGGEQLSNGSTVSKADLDAGNLQYIQSGSTNTSFQFEVNDGTENSTGNYIATLNVTASPILNSSSPTDGATEVITNSNITLTFDKNIAFATGNIQIIDLDDGSSTVIINAASPGALASISGATLTLNPSSDLEETTNYAVQIDATAIDGTDGSTFSGISDNTTLNFTTADETAPSGYTLGIDQAPINSANETAISFTFAGAEVGATYNYTFSSDGGGTNVMGTGTIVTATDQISGINLSGLGDGIVTLSVTLTDPAGNTGNASTDMLIKDTSRPSVAITSTTTDPTGEDPIPITITFDEVVGAFAIGDITVGNGTPGGFSGSGTTYMIEINPTANGFVTVDIAENVAFDNSTNGNTAAPQFSIEYNSTLSLQNELLSQGIKIYPIPNKGVLNIAADASLQLKNAQVFDITGKLIYNKDLEASVINSLELSGIRSGIYMVKICSANATATKRLVIQ